MKILLAAQYAAPAWAYGGPPKMVHDLSRGLARRGHEVTICTTDALDGERRIELHDETSDGVRTLRFRNLSNRLAWRTKIFLPLRMRRWLREQAAQFDVLHLFEARTLQNAWAAQAAGRTPIVCSAWGSLPRGQGALAQLKRLYDAKIGPLQHGRARALLAQNEHERAEYLAAGARAEQVKLWPLAIDPDEFAELPARGALRRELGIDERAPVVLFVGRINALKGLDALLHAFARTEKSARLVIVGRDDGYLAELHRLARELGLAQRMLFAGPRYGKEALAACVDCDLFCIAPSHFEETSLASLMACACGRPVLINDRCGIPWLGDYQAGVEVRSQEELGRELVRLLGDRPLLEAMGRNARRLVDEKLTLPRVLDQLEEIYRGAIAGGGA